MGGELTEQQNAHQTSTSVVLPAPAEVVAGTHMTLKVRVTCASGCDLRDGTVGIVGKEAGYSKDTRLVAFDGKVNQSGETQILGPSKLGENKWLAVFPQQEMRGVKHAESSAPFTFTVRPHQTSITILEAPDPVSAGQEFGVKVAVQCSEGCKLAQEEVEFYDNKGVKLGAARLGDVPSQGAMVFWMSQAKLKAPEAEGRYGWTAKFKPGLAVPHDGASYTFGFGVASHPDQEVTVEVVDKDTNAPVRNAQVLLRPRIYKGVAFTTRSDDAGKAKFNVANGEYQLFVTGNGKEFFQPVVAVTDGLTIKAELAVRIRQPWDY